MLFKCDTLEKSLCNPKIVTVQENGLMTVSFPQNIKIINPLNYS